MVWREPGAALACCCRQVVPSGPAQGGPCDVVSPADSSGGARLSLEESRRKEHQGGERFSPPWTHLSLVGGQGEVFSMFRDWPAAHKPTFVTARPPAGRVGRRGLVDGGKGLGKSSQKHSPKRKSPNQGMYIGCDKTLDHFAASPNPKDGASPSERFYPRGCRGNPLRFFPPAFL